MQRHPSLRWLAPLAVVGVAGLAATGVFRAQATSTRLPQTTPAALIAAAQTPHVTGFSGTVVSRMSLGLPELPMLSNGGGDEASGASMLSLLSGAHTLQVWYGGPQQQRVALLGATDETDLFRSGRQLWRWTSADRTAVHAVLPDRPASAPSVPTVPSALNSASSVTPSELARGLMHELDPTTRVTVGDERQVANRSAYELVLRPRTDSSRIGSVRIALDGATKVPLGVQVYSRDAQSPAIDVQYTSIRFERPPSTYFTFTPPSGATVKQVDVAGRLRELHQREERLQEQRPAAGSAPSAPKQPQVLGSGWTTLVRYQLPAPRETLRAVQRSGFGNAFVPVSGTWGRGRLLQSELVSVLLTDDGRVFAGAVDPSALYAAAR